MVLFRGCMVLFGGACMVLFGGMRGFIRGHAWFYSGGMHGFIWGVCMVLFEGRVWLLSVGRGACVVLFGGVCVVFFSFFGYNEIRSMSGRYASYWNAYLFLMRLHYWNVTTHSFSEHNRIRKYFRGKRIACMWHMCQLWPPYVFTVYYMTKTSWSLCLSHIGMARSKFLLFKSISHTRVQFLWEQFFFSDNGNFDILDVAASRNLFPEQKDVITG